MKYKIGDKVKIVSKEFIKGTAPLLEVEADLEQLSPKRITTIESIIGSHYFMKETIWSWPEEEIECLAEKVDELVIIDMIESRFDILDL